MIDSVLVEQVKSIVDRAQVIHVYTHAYPDGDAISSLASMNHVLTGLGKQVVCRCDTPAAEMYDWFDLQIDTRRNLPPPDAIIGLDFGQRQQQLGPLYRHVKDEFNTRPVINIDHHHLSNEQYGAVNIVENQASTTMILYDLFRSWPIAIDAKLATYLLYGIYSDTYYFQKSNTDSAALEAAAQLTSLGADPYTVAQRIHKTKSPVGLRFWGEVLASIRMYHDDRIAVASVSQEMFQRYRVEEVSLNLDGLVNFLTAVETSRVTALLKERRGEVRVSFRSDFYTDNEDEQALSIIDVCAIARRFGGGGHITAAGCSIKGSLEDAEAQVVQACVAALEDAAYQKKVARERLEEE